MSRKLPGISEPPLSDATPPPIPRWVKVFAVVAALIVLLFVVLVITGGHRPRRHGADIPALASAALPAADAFGHRS
jgi:hypothetical protein